MRTDRDNQDMITIGFPRRNEYTFTKDGVVPNNTKILLWWHLLTNAIPTVL
jgi:hypothetical protein